MDKRDRALLFRHRLASSLHERGLTQSGLARAVGVDRSTVSQLLSRDTARLPNAQVVGECAASLGVSADWLLSLTDNPERAEDIVANALTLTEAPRALVDEQIFDWHQEAAGYKIRHVPAGLPDMLKTNDMLRWEYSPHLGRTADQAIGASEDRLNWMRSSSSSNPPTVRATATTWWSSARASARAAPSPREAPVTRAILVMGLT